MVDQASINLFIDGAWRPAEDGAVFDQVDPATEEVFGKAAQAGRADAEAAIAAAARGQEVWANTAPWERAKVLRRAGLLLAERAEAVATAMTRSCGKPIAQARAEVAQSAEYFDWFAGEAQRIYGETLAGRHADQRLMATYQPVGVVAAFTAWNFPVSLQVRKIAPALAAGCAVVSRPAEEGTAAVALTLECLIDAGLPAGVVNLLTGKPEEISETVMDSDLVRKVSFTGSIPVGQYFIRRSADTVKRISMELGGHAPVIVWDDVDVEQVAKIAATGKFRNNGQVCVSPTRFYVHEKQRRDFTEAFVGATRAMRIGPGLDPATEIGPLVNRRRLEAVAAMVRETVEDGARIVHGGDRPAGFERGFFFEPTVFEGTPDAARAMLDEPFGPLAPLTGFEEFDEVIGRANSLKQGLAAYVFTRSLKRAHRTVEALKTGIVCVNNVAAATPEMPFGGVKHSGFGREGGSQGILDYLDVKFVNMVM